MNANNAIHNYLFGKHHIYRTNILVHVNSRPQYANTELISPYYLNYSYVINTNYFESTWHIFDAKKDCLLFSQLNARTHRPILVHIEQLQCGEGGATNCMYEDTFNLLYRDWIIDKLANMDPKPEGSTKLLKAMQPPTCTLGLSPPAFRGMRSSLNFSCTLTTGPLISKLNSAHRQLSYHIGPLTNQLEDSPFLENENFPLYFSVILFSFYLFTLFPVFVPFFFTTIKD